MKPHLHANASVSKFGGKAEDYIEIHNFIDSSKAHFPDMRHRSLLHSSFGIFICERIFGVTMTNSDGKVFSVRDVAEEHVLQDLGTIPTVQDYLQHMTPEPWMSGPETRSRKFRFSKKPLLVD